jgi:hypothetical protein
MEKRAAMSHTEKPATYRGATMKSALEILLFGLAGLATLVATGGRAVALDRPAWMDEPGIVMAGNWEEPSFRARRMGRTDYTLPADKLADYAREHSPEMIAQLKDLGVNFVMTHCYKGAGLKTERQGMEDTRRFAELAHKAGLRVGAYIGGTLLYERLFEEMPPARQWQAFGPHGEPLYYDGEQKFRYAPVRNRPGFTEYLKEPVRFAIEQVHADLIHFDNFGTGGESYDAFSKRQFRAFLARQGKTPHDPPLSDRPNSDPLVRLWTQYKCKALADHYEALSRYIRSLNPQCGVECNPGEVDGYWNTAAVGVDHSRLLPSGNAYWDESMPTAWSEKDRLATTRIRSLKVGELYNNSSFLYCESTLDLAESMAYNVNCLGCVAWFEWGKVTTAHQSGKPVPPEMKAYIRFFLDHQDLYRRWPSVADVAVLRTFAEHNFGRRKYFAVEQALIQGHVAWRIIYDRQLDDLDGYRVLVVPDREWLTAEQQRKIARFAEQGGQVARSTSISKPAEFLAAILNHLRVVADAPSSVALELREQSKPQRVLVHLVNYNVKQPIKNVVVRLRVKSGAPTSVRLISPDPSVSGPIHFDSTPGECSFTIPELRLYAAVVVDGIGV